MNITFFYTDECKKCAELKPIITEFSKNLGTYGLTVDQSVTWPVDRVHNP